MQRCINNGDSTDMIELVLVCIATRVASLDTEGDGWNGTIQVVEQAFLLILGCVCFGSGKSTVCLFG